MSDVNVLLAKWKITIKGEFERAGYLVRLDRSKKGRVIIDPQGNQLPGVFPYFYLAIKHVNALLGD